jgi:hypothetical protein
MRDDETVSPRTFIALGAGVVGGAALWAPRVVEEAPRLR